MKYFLVAFLLTIGWKTGLFVFDVITSFMYKLIPEKYRKKGNRVSYRSYY